MRLYLSSFRMGYTPERYLELSNGPKKVAYIPNAIDYLEDMDFRNMIIENDIADLQSIGLDVEIIDLQQYFNSQDELSNRMEEFGYIWVTGGNGFVLNRAFKLSGFDGLLTSYYKGCKDVVYGGFSCATYVIATSLKGMEQVDDPDEDPYDMYDIEVWDGVGLIDFNVIPHYDSEHFESEKMGGVLKYMMDNGIKHKVLRDGEAIVV